MSRESRLSTLRQRPSETNSDFLNRFLEDLLITEYTGFSLEKRRVSHFIINALSDPNHRQNTSIQYQHLKQPSTHSFDYWLSVLRSLPSSNPTLPIGLHHANLTSNLPRTTTDTTAPTHPKAPLDQNIRSNPSYNSPTCSHCGRYGHLSTHCFHNPASTSDNHNFRLNNHDSSYMNRRSQSPNTSRQFSSYSKYNSPSRSSSPHSSRPNSPFKRSVQPQNHLLTRDTDITLQDTIILPIRTNPVLNTKPEISLKGWHTNISTYETCKNKISFDNKTTNTLPKERIGHGAPNYDSVIQDNSSSHGMSFFPLPCTSRIPRGFENVGLRGTHSALLRSSSYICSLCNSM